MSTSYGPARPEVSHYRHGSIEPIDYIRAHSLNFLEGNVVKYVTRWRYKDGLRDLLKARDYLNWLIDDAQLLEQDIQAARVLQTPVYRAAPDPADLVDEMRGTVRGEEPGTFIGSSMPADASTSDAFFGRARAQDEPPQRTRVF